MAGRKGVQGVRLYSPQPSYFNFGLDEKYEPANVILVLMALPTIVADRNPRNWPSYVKRAGLKICWPNICLG